MHLVPAQDSALLSMVVRPSTGACYRSILMTKPTQEALLVDWVIATVNSPMNFWPKTKPRLGATQGGNKDTLKGNNRCGIFYALKLLLQP